MDNPKIDAIVSARVADELTPIDMEARFNDMLDECYSFDAVGGPFANMSPSRVLLEVDPIAHRCGVNDYADSISRDRDITEIDGEYYDTEEVQAIRDEVEAEQADDTDEDDEDDEDDDGRQLGDDPTK